MKGEIEMVEFKSPLHKMEMTTPTDFWNDSCSVEELTYAIDNGAVGATTNPTIILNVLKKEMYLWKDRIHQIIRDNPTWSEVEVTWKVAEELAVNGAKMLYPVFQRENEKKGRISVQTNPQFYRNAQAIVEQAIHFHSLAPNIQVKIPVTKAGLVAVEEATALGINITATVAFTVPQAIAVAEAVERGLRRREAQGLPVETMNPISVTMFGRTDDWMHVVAKRDKIAIDPGYLNWAGIACIKRIYEIFQERKYRAHILGAAIRHHMHWSEMIGGKLTITLPYEWQLLFNASDIEVIDRIQNPVDPKIIDALCRKIPDFRRAYEPGGLTIDEFDTYGATVRTLRSFISSYHDLVNLIRDFMLPNPDVT
jgi:transaldolase